MHTNYKLMQTLETPQWQVMVQSSILLANWVRLVVSAGTMDRFLYDKDEQKVLMYRFS